MHQHDAPEARPPGSLRELVHIAFPLVISFGSSALQYVVDRVFLSWYQMDAVGAAFFSAALHWTLLSLPFGLVAYAMTFVAQYEGAKQPERVPAVIWHALYFALAAGAMTALLVPFFPTLIGYTRHESAIQTFEIEYLSVLCLGTAPILAGHALAGFFSGRGRTTVVMWANVACTLVNIGFDYLLIFGNLGFPRMGVQGAATATVLGYVVAAAIYAVKIATGPEESKYPWLASWRWDGELFDRLVRFGFPNGMQIFLDVICFTVFLQLVGTLGSRQFTASCMAFNLNNLIFVPLLGIGTAVTSLTGRRIGEGRPRLAARTTWLAFALAEGYVALLAALFVFAPDLVLYPYSLGAEPEKFQAIRAIMIEMLRFVAVYSLFDAMFVIFGAAIRGAGDTRFAVFFSFAAGMTLMVGPTFFAVQHWKDDYRLPWLAATTYVVVLGVGLFARFQFGPWMSMRVIDTTEPLEPVDEAAEVQAGAADPPGVYCE